MLAIAFDADDTLWHNENIFENVHQRYRQLLARYHDPAEIDRRLFETEMRNLDLYGYGVKSFTLSAIETAIQLSSAKIPAAEIQNLIDLGRQMLDHPVELLPAAAEIIPQLAQTHTLLLITKGDLRDQQRKLEKSTLAPHFTHVEIVSEKNTETYRAILDRHAIAPENFLMVGNSVKSDLLPVLALGARAAHIPYHLLWQHERTEKIPADNPRFHELQTLADLPALIAKINTPNTQT